MLKSKGAVVGVVILGLVIVAGNYAIGTYNPDLKATANFRDLRTQLEGTENRIAVERMRFNDSAKKFNAYRQSFSQFLLANLLGARFTEKPYFRARADAASPPQVRFE